MGVLQRWGLAQQVEEAGIPLERVEIIDRKDGLIRAMDLRSIRDRLGHTTVSIHRAALHRILRSKLPQKTLRLGKTCQGLEIYDDAVVAHFKEGGKATGNLLVGADGIRSFIRDMVNSYSKLRYSGQSCYRGIASFTLPPERVRTRRRRYGTVMSVSVFPPSVPTRFIGMPPLSLPRVRPRPRRA